MEESWDASKKVVVKLKKFLGEIDMDNRAKEIDLSIDNLSPLKTLGVWSASSDQFSFSTASLVENIVLKNRTFLRKISAQFAHLRLVTPFVVRAKIFMQEV